MRYINGSNPSTFVDITASGVLQVDTIDEFTVGSSVSFPDNIKVDTINESTTNNGVNVDSMLIKNGYIQTYSRLYTDTWAMTSGTNSINLQIPYSLFAIGKLRILTVQSISIVGSLGGNISIYQTSTLSTGDRPQSNISIIAVVYNGSSQTTGEFWVNTAGSVGFYADLLSSNFSNNFGCYGLSLCWEVA